MCWWWEEVTGRFRNSPQLLGSWRVLWGRLQRCNCCFLRSAWAVMEKHPDLIQHRVRFIMHVRFSCIIICLYVAKRISLSRILLWLISFIFMRCCPNVRRWLCQGIASWVMMDECRWILELDAWNQCWNFSLKCLSILMC